MHADKGELHGKTVVIHTTGPRVFVGRFFEPRPETVLLLDVDHHDEGEDGVSNADYVAKTARFGQWKKHARFEIPLGEITSIDRLADVASA